MQTEGVTKSLAARDDFVLFLFTLMTNKKTFLQTATLIEDILGVKKVRVVLVSNPQHERVGSVGSRLKRAVKSVCDLCGDTFGKPVILKSYIFMCPFPWNQSNY